jgi:hypothetical protein
MVERKLFEREFKKVFDDTTRYRNAVKGLEEYIGVVREDFAMDPCEGPNGEIMYSFSSRPFAAGGSSSYVSVEVVADPGHKTFDGKISSESGVHVTEVFNKLLLSLVLGKSAQVKK